MPTTVGATMSSIRRSNSVTRACFLDVLGHGRFTNEKSGFSAHSIFFGSSREPDEDGADIGALPSTGKGIRQHFVAVRGFFYMWWRLRLREYLRTAIDGGFSENSFIFNDLHLKARPAAQPQENGPARQHFFFVARRRPVGRPFAPVGRAFGQPFEGRMGADVLDHPG